MTQRTQGAVLTEDGALRTEHGASEDVLGQGAAHCPRATPLIPEARWCAWWDLSWPDAILAASRRRRAMQRHDQYARTTRERDVEQLDERRPDDQAYDSACHDKDERADAKIAVFKVCRARGSARAVAHQYGSRVARCHEVLSFRGRMPRTHVSRGTGVRPDGACSRAYAAWWSAVVGTKR